MKIESQLELQAYLDGELPDREARRIEEWLAKDRAAQDLLGELKMVRTALLTNEPAVILPASREFNWSQIQQRIQRSQRAEARAQVPRPNFLSLLRQMLVPFAGVAAVCLLAVVTLRSQTNSGTWGMTEVENLSPAVNTVSFRADKMFVVWVSDQNNPATAEVSSDETETVTP